MEDFSYVKVTKIPNVFPDWGDDYRYETIKTKKIIFGSIQLTLENIGNIIGFKPLKNYIKKL